MASENDGQQLSLSLNQTGYKASAQEERNLILSRTEQSIDEQGSDRILDKRSEKKFIIEFRQHNPTNRYVNDTVRTYQVTVCSEFYEEICRLKGWPAHYAIKRPAIVARYTIHLLYLRFPKEVIKTLQKNNPFAGSARRFKHFQLLSDVAEMEFRVFIDEAVATMKQCVIWSQFVRRYSKNHGLPYQTDLFLD